MQPASCRRAWLIAHVLLFFGMLGEVIGDNTGSTFFPWHTAATIGACDPISSPLISNSLTTDDIPTASPPEALDKRIQNDVPEIVEPRGDLLVVSLKYMGVPEAVVLSIGSSLSWIVNLCLSVPRTALARLLAWLEPLQAGINSHTHTQVAAAWLAVAVTYFALKYITVPTCQLVSLEVDRRRACLRDNNKHRMQRAQFSCARSFYSWMAAFASFFSSLWGFPLFLMEFLWDVAVYVVASVAKVFLPRACQVLFTDFTYSRSFLVDDTDPTSTSRGASRRGSRRHKKGLFSALTLHADLDFEMPDEPVPQRPDLALVLPANVLLWSYAAHLRQPWVPAYGWLTSTLILRFMLANHPWRIASTMFISSVILVPVWLKSWVPMYCLYSWYMLMGGSAFNVMFCAWSFCSWRSVARCMIFAHQEFSYHDSGSRAGFWSYVPGTGHWCVYRKAASRANQLVFRLATKLAEAKVNYMGYSYIENPDQWLLRLGGLAFGVMALCRAEDTWGPWHACANTVACLLAGWPIRRFAWRHQYIALAYTCAAVWYAPLQPLNCATCMLIVLMHLPSDPMATASHMVCIASSADAAVGYPLSFAWAVCSRLWFMTKVVLKDFAERQHTQQTLKEAGESTAAAEEAEVAAAAAAAAAASKASFNCKGRQEKQQQQGSRASAKVCSAAGAAATARTAFTGSSSSSQQGVQSEHSKHQQPEPVASSKQERCVGWWSRLGGWWESSKRAHGVPGGAGTAGAPASHAFSTAISDKPAAAAGIEMGEDVAEGPPHQRSQSRRKEKQQQGKKEYLLVNGQATAKESRRSRSKSERPESSELTFQQHARSSGSASSRKSREDGLVSAGNSNNNNLASSCPDIHSPTSRNRNNRSKQSGRKAQCNDEISLATTAVAAASGKAPLVVAAAAAASKDAIEVSAPPTPSLSTAKSSSPPNPFDDHPFNNPSRSSKPDRKMQAVQAPVPPSTPVAALSRAAAAVTPITATAAGASAHADPTVAVSGSGQIEAMQQLLQQPSSTAAIGAGPTTPTTPYVNMPHVTRSYIDAGSSSSSDGGHGSDDSESGSSRGGRSGGKGSSPTIAAAASPVFMWTFLDQLQAKAQAHREKTGDRPSTTTTIPAAAAAAPMTKPLVPLAEPVAAAAGGVAGPLDRASAATPPPPTPASATAAATAASLAPAEPVTAAGAVGPLGRASAATTTTATTTTPADGAAERAAGSDDSTRRIPIGKLGGVCVVCGAGECCVLLLPCKHVVLCQGCSEGLQASRAACPKCEEQVTRHVLVRRI